MAVKNGPSDNLMINAMCNKFSFVSTAGKYAKWAADFCAYSLARGDYGSANWMPPSAGILNEGLILLHHQLEFYIGTDEVTDMVQFGVTDFGLDVSIPLQVQQDCVSGLKMQEPVMEGKYDIKISATISRHDSDALAALRDLQTTVLTKACYESNYRTITFLSGTNKIEDAGPDDGTVAKEPVTLTPGWQATKPFPVTIISSLYQGSPLVCIVRDTNSDNPAI